MTIKFARRVAAEITKRGVNSIRIAPTKMEDVKKAMTRDDVRKLIKDGIHSGGTSKAQRQPELKGP